MLAEQESGLLKLAHACDARYISGRRDRGLLLLALGTGLPIGRLVSLRLWQLTYFFEFRLGCDHEKYPKRSGRVGRRPAPYTQIGVYSDDSFERLLPIPRSIYKVLRGYVTAFREHEDRSHYLFPVIRKNSSIVHGRHLTVRDAHKLLRRMIDASACGRHYDWHTIRQIAVAKYLHKNLSIQEIMARTGYRDPKSVRDIAKLYGMVARSDPSFAPPRYVGLDC